MWNNMTNNQMNNMRYLMNDDIYGVQNRNRRSCCCCNKRNRLNGYRGSNYNSQNRQRYSDPRNIKVFYEDMIDYQRANNNLYNADDNSWG